MTKRALLLACTLLLGGCALPVPVQIASWAVDGLLYITTEKTMIDHGVSIVAERDCAMLRVVTEGTLCRDDNAATLVASAETPATTTDVPIDGPALAADDAVVRLAAFETAAGGEDRPESPAAPSESPYLALDSEESPARTAVVAPDADWQAIVDVALFIERLMDPARAEALSDPALQWTSGAPPAPDEFGAILPGIDLGLLLIDDGGAGNEERGRQYADGSDGLAIRGDAGTDALPGTIPGGGDRDRSPMPTPGDSRSCTGGPGHARIRPPRRSLRVARGRGPPNGQRLPRVHDPHVPEGGLGPP